MFEAEVNPEKITRADLVVSIPSYKEADSIAFPTQQASEGLSRYFSEKRSVIINCDNNSPDNTKGAGARVRGRRPRPLRRRSAL